VSDIFVTETMAELSARQGRIADAIGIYRRLLGGASSADDRRAKWAARLSALEGGAAAEPDGDVEPYADIKISPGVAAAVAPAAPAAPRDAVAPAAPAPGPEPALRLPLVVREPVRSGQIVYAQHGDLIVLAPVNPGAQLLADGNIHIYAPLRGRAVAGVRGAAEAQIFCFRLEAELVGIDAAFLLSDDIPAALRGRAVRIWLEAGRCWLAPIESRANL
jgi:septum site-determining protein MinC